MSYLRGRTFKFEANHIIPEEVISGDTVEAENARELLADIGFNIEARANKMMLFVSEAARDAVLAAPTSVRDCCAGIGISPLCARITEVSRTAMRGHVPEMHVKI